MRLIGRAGEPIPRTTGAFYSQVQTGSGLCPRLRVFLDEYEKLRARLDRPLRVLDVGCGRQAVLAEHMNTSDEYWACDIAMPDEDVQMSRFELIDLNQESLLARLGQKRFDVIFCGEVIEHVFSPDALFVDLDQLLSPEGLLILSTPNLAYWLNRLLLLFGISPLFVENSAVAKLGRGFRFLGQGNSTEGHIRMFTHRAMLDFLQMHGAALLGVRSVPVWPFFLDRIVTRISKNLSPVNVYLLGKRTGRS